MTSKPAISQRSQRSGPRWTNFDAMRYALPEILGGGWPYVRRFKFAWVTYHAKLIVAVAHTYRIPPLLLGGVAWIEVGGDPPIKDSVGYEGRAFDWSGPDWMDRNLTITNRPDRTSFGAVSIQLRRAAETLGLRPERMSDRERRQLITWLENDASNLKIVALHLKALILIDWPNADTRHLTDDQIRVVGARYNRGPDLSLDAIRKNMSYGEVIVNIAAHLRPILNQ